MLKGIKCLLAIGILAVSSLAMAHHYGATVYPNGKYEYSFVRYCPYTGGYHYYEYKGTSHRHCHHCGYNGIGYYEGYRDGYIDGSYCHHPYY